MTQTAYSHKYSIDRAAARLQHEQHGFQIHRTIYTIVIPVLTVLNIVLVPQFFWFFFPLVGWGLGLTMHYIFGVRQLKKVIEGGK